MSRAQERSLVLACGLLVVLGGLLMATGRHLAAGLA